MKIAFLGTGILGFPMAEKLLDCGHQLWVYNRTIEKAKPLAKKGAIVCRDPADALLKGEGIIIVLSDFFAIEEVLLKHKTIALKGKTVIQMGTISSLESLRLKKRIESCGGDYFECPVLGSRNEAQAAQLILMVGATQGQFRCWAPVLKCFGPHPRLIGPVGRAAALKLALNQLIAAHATSFSLSLGLIQKSGVDVATFMSILNDSSLVAPMYAKKLPNWLSHNYDNPNFPLRHLIKDVDLIIKEASRAGVNMEILKAVKKVLARCKKEGFGDKDYSAVYETINKL